MLSVAIGAHGVPTIDAEGEGEAVGRTESSTAGRTASSNDGHGFTELPCQAVDASLPAASATLLAPPAPLSTSSPSSDSAPSGPIAGQALPQSRGVQAMADIVLSSGPRVATAASVLQAGIPGLDSWLAALGLTAYGEAVHEWVDEMGAISLEEIVENADSLQEFVPMKPLDARRLEKNGLAVAQRLSAYTCRPDAQQHGIVDMPPYKNNSSKSGHFFPSSSSSAAICDAGVVWPHLHAVGKGEAKVAPGQIGRVESLNPYVIKSRGKPRPAAAAPSLLKPSSPSSRSSANGQHQTQLDGPLERAGTRSIVRDNWDCEDPWSAAKQPQSALSSACGGFVRKGKKGQRKSGGKGAGPASLESDGWELEDPWSAARKPKGAASSQPRSSFERKQQCATVWTQGHRGHANDSTSSASGLRSLRVPLCVDKIAGAGLSLLWCQDAGFLVTGIDSWPGQPQLCIDDVIFAIAGVSLADAKTEEEAERRFERAFRHGAELEVERADNSPDDDDGVEGFGASGCSPVFEARLRVLPQPRGAGLSLVWLAPEGFLVEEVDPEPGQTQLLPGDVIRSVGGQTLGGHASEEAAGRILSAALRDGARARVFRPDVDARLGDLVALTTGSSLPLLVSALGVGTWSWGGQDRWGAGERPSPADAASAALDAGCFFFDTAPTYGKGFAEKELGRIRAGGRYALVATKYYPRPNDIRDLSGAMQRTARESISRLRPDAGVLDLFQLHRLAEPPTSLEVQADALASVVRAGLARAVGVCNASAEEVCALHERLRRTHALPLSSCQLELSLLRQLPAMTGTLEVCRELGVAVLAFSPLAMGRLTGKYDPVRGEKPWWGRHGDEQRPFGATLDESPSALMALLAALRATGRRYGGKTPAQVALNWVLSQGAVALPGARTRKQALENAGAMGWRLSAEDCKALAALGASGSVSDFQHG